MLNKSKSHLEALEFLPVAEVRRKREDFLTGCGQKVSYFLSRILAEFDELERAFEAGGGGRDGPGGPGEGGSGFVAQLSFDDVKAPLLAPAPVGEVEVLPRGLA